MKNSLCIVLFLIQFTPGWPQTHTVSPDQKAISVNIQENLTRLIDSLDKDGDKKITVADVCPPDQEKPARSFRMIDKSGNRYQIVDIFHLANLLQEFKLAQDADCTFAEIRWDRIYEKPVDRISRSIRAYYWAGLTRRIDVDHLEQILVDEKSPSGDQHYLYVPASDPEALAYFTSAARRHPDIKLTVQKLPDTITPSYVNHLAGKHGILTLALIKSPDGKLSGAPFVVPGGRFNEMYGWDSYFIVLGLLADGQIELAMAMVDNFVYQIRHYGKILNANRTYYLTRSQPPFLTSMALAVYEKLDKNSENKDWLRRAFLAAIQEYHQVWMHPDRLTKTGLSRYFGSGIGPPPEVEPGHYDPIYRPYAQARQMDIREFERLYQSGKIKVPDLDIFFVHDRAVRESGHDTSYRWEWDGFRCADFVTVDLNALLYKIELDLARTIARDFSDRLIRPDGKVETSHAWYERAQKRKSRIQKYLWNEPLGMFLDYDLKKKQQHVYISATTFYPLWASHADDPDHRLVTPKQLSKLVAAALPQLEMAGGIAASAEASRGPLSESRPARQWDYPNGWAPHQMMIWQGLLNYGQEEIAFRLAYRWLYTITRNAVDYNGTITEKLDVVARSHAVFAEYGNVGSDFAYITREGFGWTNASYQVGLDLLPDQLIDYLNRLIPPEWLFSE